LQAGAAGLILSAVWLWRQTAHPLIEKETSHAR